MPSFCDNGDVRNDAFNTGELVHTLIYWVHPMMVGGTESYRFFIPHNMSMNIKLLVG